MDDNEHHCRNNKDGLDDNIHHQFQENNESIQACNNTYRLRFLYILIEGHLQAIQNTLVFWSSLQVNLFEKNVLGEFSHKYFHKILILPEICSGMIP